MFIYSISLNSTKISILYTNKNYNTPLESNHTKNKY